MLFHENKIYNGGMTKSLADNAPHNKVIGEIIYISNPLTNIPLVVGKRVVLKILCLENIGDKTVGKIYNINYF